MEPPETAESGWRIYDVLKRVMDIAISSVVLIAAAPLCLLIAIAIRLTSSGSALYRQRAAVGRGGRSFTLYKFRTMRDDAQDTSHREAIARFVKGEIVAHQEAKGAFGPVYKMVNDPRVTRLGRFLRKTGLDEIPQFYNVVRGDMSIVGPRPPVAYEYEQYDERQRRRLAIRPGITGLYQVSARSQVSLERMVEIDLEYIRRRSFTLDLSIMLRTPWVMFSGRGAY